MDRRTLLQTGGGLATAFALAGCQGPSGSSATPSRKSSTTPGTAGSAGAAATSATGTRREYRSEQGVAYDGGAFASRHMRGQQVPWLVLYPPGHGPGDHLPVLITLHGTGGNQSTPWALRWPETSRALAAEGARPFACAGIKGGDTWWHPRKDGTDSAALVSDEFLSVLADHGLDVARPAIYGYSMGGVGAIYLGATLGKGKVSSVVATSAPFIPSFADSRGAYDSPDDFERHDVRGLWPRLEGIPVRVDIGDQDAFLDQNWAFLRTARPVPEFHLTPGGHDPGYWGRVALDQLRFVASHL